MFENIRYDLKRIAYGRRGTFLYLSVYEEEGEDRLYVCALLSGLDTAGPGQNPRVGKLFPIKLTRGGKTLSYKAEATPDPAPHTETLSPIQTALPFPGG